MTDNRAQNHIDGGRNWLIGGGKMGELVRTKDRSETPLGPIDCWPQSLRTTVSLCLASNFPISLAWGPEFTQIYNDGYWPICAGKHPRSMGQDFRECWASAWPAVGEAFERAVSGETSYLENQRMFLDRNGYLEETFFTFSFSPIRDETGGVGGLFHPVTETTGNMLGARRARALRDLAARTGKAQTTEEVFSVAAQTLADYELDLPFVLLYTLDAGATRGQLAGSAGLAPGTVASPPRLMLDAPAPFWPLAPVVQSGAVVEVEHLRARWGGLACGPYPEAPDIALALPITPPGAGHPAAIFIAGVSSRLPLNDIYRGFYEQLAAAITAGVANARAYEEEKQRAERLAALDRAKTAFFSNISHELRTPLTLILGPLEDALAHAGDALSAVDRENLIVAHRSGLRLLKLVNALLDFSRVEAGRIQAIYEPTDLATLTTNLTSVFRSAIEKAGLELVVATPPLPEPVYVDREMWEKIVLNLLSNALKFTMHGRITVTQHVVGDRVELAVEDTGVGIPYSELGNVFKRFYRIEGTEGRTHEGTGIGLALVEELVKLHGGTVAVQSTLGHGSTFTVSVPLGTAHLPADRLGVARAQSSTGMRADAFVEEALRWLPESEVTALLPSEVETAVPVAGPRLRVLLADDNTDMREYVQRLLGAHYEVEAVPDGEAAWSAIQLRRPDLLLTDIMMPRLDGFGLLARIRQDAATQSLPVILLSARAGEESRIEGLQAGADDYLIKPFSARELVARVQTNLELGRMRQQAVRLEEQLKAEQPLRESEARLRAAMDSIVDEVWFTDAQGEIILINDAALRNLGIDNREVFFRNVREALTGLEIFYPDGTPRPPEQALLLRAVRGEVMRSEGEQVRNIATGELRDREVSSAPVRDVAGRIIGAVAVIRDVTERKQAERERERLLRELAHRAAELTATFDSIADGVLIYDQEAKPSYMNATAARLLGLTPEESVLPLEERLRQLPLTRTDGTPVPYEAGPTFRALQGETVLGEVLVLHRQAQHPLVLFERGPHPPARWHVRRRRRQLHRHHPATRTAGARAPLPLYAGAQPARAGYHHQRKPAIAAGSIATQRPDRAVSSYRGGAAARLAPDEHHDR